MMDGWMDGLMDECLTFGLETHNFHWSQVLKLTMVRFEVQTLIQFDPYGLPLHKVQLLKSEKMGLREHICFYFATKGSKRCFYWGVPNVPKKIGDGVNVAPSKQYKKIREKKMGMHP
jgi:hypothetical protein